MFTNLHIPLVLLQYNIKKLIILTFFFKLLISYKDYEKFIVYLWRNDFLLYLSSSISHMVFGFSCCLSFSSCKTYFPPFWIIPMAFKRMETAFCLTLNWSASSCWIWISSSSNKACKWLSSNFLLMSHALRFFTLKSPIFNFLNHPKHCILPRACSLKLQQAFDVILQQFSSNANKKLMLSADCSL